MTQRTTQGHRSWNGLQQWEPICFITEGTGVHWPLQEESTTGIWYSSKKAKNKYRFQPQGKSLMPSHTASTDRFLSRRELGFQSSTHCQSCCEISERPHGHNTLRRLRGQSWESQLAQTISKDLIKYYYQVLKSTLLEGTERSIFLAGLPEARSCWRNMSRLETRKRRMSFRPHYNSRRETDGWKRWRIWTLVDQAAAHGRYFERQPRAEQHQS